jgi:DNA polymerase-1
MVQDQQHLVYENLFKLAIVDIIQMQLTGMPVDMAQVAEVEEILQAGQDQAVADMRATNILQSFTYRLREEHVEKRNGELKKKRISLADAETLAVEFNPNSGPQLIKLLYEHVGLPVISTTESKQPSTDGDTLEALRNHTSDPDVLGFLDGLIAYKAVNKILTSFIPALKGAVRGPDGWYYLFGNFNLGGTVSGRLSSSDPNLQNLPANVVMKLTAVFLTRFGERVAPYVEKDELLLGKLVKSCFKAPPGWHFVGIDFNSLEDRISALTTKDPNKLRVYTDGYDGHSLRAHAYFGDQMPDIDPDSVESINSIQKKYKPLRQDSKAPTFALTYQGTYVTLMANCGFSEAKAKAIEARYHEFYAVSDQWVADRLDRACKDGYVTAAFGLRVRTPLLHQVIRGTRKTPFEAEAEGRTAGNALGQSWCLLNTRAGSDFLNQVRGSERFRLSVKPCAQIHDAQYFLVRDDLEVMAWVNERVVKACEWQDHPEIWHDEVKLGGELSIFWPNWSQEVGIHNGASEQEILDVFTKHVLDLQAAG